MYGKIRKNNNKTFIEVDDPLVCMKLEGELIHLTVKNVRSIDTHKRYFEVLKIFVDHAPEVIILSLLNVTLQEFNQLTKSKSVLEERVRKAIEMQLGFVEDRKMILDLGNGEKINVTQQIPKSIAYEKMTEDDFVQLHKNQKQLMFDLLKDYGWSEENFKELFKDFYKSYDNI